MSGLGAIAEFFGGYPGFLPGLVVSTGLGLAASGPVSRSLGTGRVLAWALVVAVGMILSATLTPSPSGLQRDIVGVGPLEHYHRTCDLSRIGPAPIDEYLHVSNTSLNVLLFMPLGLVVGLLPRSRGKKVLVLAALALPAAVETVQLVAVPLDRACQAGDVFDNVAGVILGLAVGSGAGWLATRWRA